MSTIQAVSIEELLSPKAPREPSARTVWTQKIASVADSVVQSVNETGAAVITLDEEDAGAGHYLGRLRAALRRKGQTDILLRKNRGGARITAWKARPEDAAGIAKRKATGAKLGGAAKARAATRKRVLEQATTAATRAGA